MHLMTPLACLVGYALWTMLLVGFVALQRVLQVLAGKKASNAFPSGVQHGSDAYWRANRAHVNAAENLPVYAALVLVAAVVSHDTPRFATLAAITLGARVVQSIIHLSSNSVLAVNARFTAFCVQLGCQAVMAFELLSRA